MPLLSLVIYIIVLGLIIWLLLFLVQQIPMGEPFATVARVLIIAVGVIILISILLQLIGHGPIIRLGDASDQLVRLFVT